MKQNYRNLLTVHRKNKGGRGRGEKVIVVLTMIGNAYYYCYEEDLFSPRIDLVELLLLHYYILQL
jgi:hypothetical protein